MIRVLSWPAKTIRTIKEEGIGGLSEKVGILSREFGLRIKKARGNKPRDSFYDVLFINGCDHSVPHPIRYRVDHQIEQLKANGMAADSVFYRDLSVEDVRRARNFIIFRCPYTDTVGEFIAKARELNKKVYFDIDDLVIDTKYTDAITHLDSLSPDERSTYDQGVLDMQKTLRLCDSAITTTEALAQELKNYVPEVYINRNTASEEMVELSQEALYMRGELLGLSPEQVPTKYRKKHQKLVDQERARDKSIVSIGYFSGSITHNEDFEMILPVLIRVFEERKNVRLHIAGELDLPESLELYRNRIQTSPFTSWKELPNTIAEVDLNLAPLTESVFNEAKSENKWVEASLVKVPTIASKIGAFERMIENDRTGILCETQDDWYNALIRLVDNNALREEIANNAYDYCMNHCLTINSGNPFASYIKERQIPNIAFIVPSLNTSGGILVALKHCAILQDAGYDVMLLGVDNDRFWYDFDDHTLPVLNRERTMCRVDDTPIEGHIDKGVATFWDTVNFLERYGNMSERLYLVQNFETDFYKVGDKRHRLVANATYCKNVQYLTISKWCERWLKEDFDRAVKFARNGLDVKKFWPIKRSYEGKIRILIEGDYSAHKNVDESFRIVDKLDPEKFEIWYMSYMPKPKSYYRIDNFLGAVPHDDVPDVYRECHILIKTSILESFSYPPLEMMSTGGQVVVLPNEGNSEYLEDGYNCLFYERGNIDQAVEAIHRICDDPALRETLYQGGLDTAQKHDWDTLRNEICDLYQGSVTRD